MGDDHISPRLQTRAFDGTNYSIWRKRIRSLINDEDALRVLDENPPREPTTQWKKYEKVAKGLITKHLADNMLGFSEEEDTAREVIAKLDDTFKRASLTNQLSTERKLLELKFKEDTTLTLHFVKFDALITEFEGAGANLNEMNKIARLLFTLPDSYENIVTAIETLTDKDLTLAFVKNRLLDFEVKHNKIKTKNNIDTSAKVLVASTNEGNHQVRDGFRKQKPRKSKQRRFNNRIQPYQKGRSFHQQQQHHYQPPRQNQPQLRKNCYVCGRSNHVAKDCYFSKNPHPQSSLKSIQTAQVEDNKHFAWLTVAEPVGSQPIERTDKLMFYLDSGATDHICKELEKFNSIKDLEEPIRLSTAKNGQAVTATKVGSISIITDVGKIGVLENVLYSSYATSWIQSNIF